MQVSAARVRSVSAIRWVMYALTAVLLMQASVPERAFAEGDLDSGEGEYDSGPCMDQAWKDYNACLMSTPFEWEKKLCDAAFASASYACLAEALGKIWCKLKNTCQEDEEDEDEGELW